MTKNSGEPSENMPDQFGDFEIAPENQLDDFFTDSQPTSQLAAITPDNSEETTTHIVPSAEADVTEAFWGGGVTPDTVAVSSNLTDDLPDVVAEIPDYDYLGHVEYEPEFEDEDDSSTVAGGYFGNQQLLEDINIPQKSRFSSVAGSRRFWNAVVAAAVVAVAASAAWVLGFRESGPTESAQESAIDSSAIKNSSVTPQELASPTTSREVEEETPEEEQKAEEVLNVFPRMEQSVTAMKKETEKPTTTEVPRTVAVSTEKTVTTERTSSFVTTTAPPVTSPSIVPPPQSATTLPTTATPVTTFASTETTEQQTTASPTTVPQTTTSPTTPQPVTTVKPTTTAKPTTTEPVTTVETTVEETTTTVDTCEDAEVKETTTTVEGGILAPIITISLPQGDEDCDSELTDTAAEDQETTTVAAVIASTSNQ